MFKKKQKFFNLKGKVYRIVNKKRFCHDFGLRDLKNNFQTHTVLCAKDEVPKMTPQRMYETNNSTQNIEIFKILFHSESPLI